MPKYRVDSYDMRKKPETREWSREVEAESAIDAICKVRGLTGNIKYVRRSGAALSEGEHPDNAHWQQNPRTGHNGSYAVRIED